ncbi:MAG: YbjN domain-containing protein [Agitococcus sp.]|nr:YbjN domain-containing protein [Agitococcus sp.]
MSDLITAISPQQLAHILQQAGYRATEVNNGQMEQIQSATQGIGFVINFGNVVSEQNREFVDFSFNCTLNIEGNVRPELVADWNRSRRFARLSQQGQWLVLVMDVMVAGGVSAAWLQGQCELWDALLREYIRHLQTPATASVATEAA